MGNPGSLALALALAAVSCLGVLLWSGRTRVARRGGLGAVVFVCGLLVNRNLTSWTALVAGTAILLLICRYGRRAAPGIAVLLLLLGAGVLRVPAHARHARCGGRIGVARSGLGPPRHVPARAWSAAVEMARERPWTGFGPGTYGAEFVPHRLRAEIALRRKLVNPLSPRPMARRTATISSSLRRRAFRPESAFSRPSFSSFRGLWKTARPGGPPGSARRGGFSPGVSRCRGRCRADMVSAAAPHFGGAAPPRRGPRLEDLRADGAGQRAGGRNNENPPRFPSGRRPGVALAPEIPRYAAERMLRPATDSLRYLVSHPGEVSDPRGSARPHPADRARRGAGTARRLAPARARGILPARRRGHRRGSRLLQEGARTSARGQKSTSTRGRAYEANGETEKAAAAFPARCVDQPGARPGAPAGPEDPGAPGVPAPGNRAASGPALFAAASSLTIALRLRGICTSRRTGRDPRWVCGRGRSGRSRGPRCGACRGASSSGSRTRSAPRGPKAI